MRLHSSFRPDAPRRKWMLLAAALAAASGGVLAFVLLPDGCMRTQMLMLAQMLQHQWEAVHLVSDNLRGALAPDSGSKAACRSGLLRLLERVGPGGRALLAHSLAWLATGHRTDGGSDGAL